MIDDDESDVEREILQGRKFTPQEALARIAGPGAMKGASPVARSQQAEIEVGTWLGSNLADPDGALRVVLHRQLKGSRLLLDNIDQPLVALAAFCRRILVTDHLLQDVVREADFEWGRMMDERPRFERAGVPAHPDDPYTAQSVADSLRDALDRLPAEA